MILSPHYEQLAGSKADATTGFGMLAFAGTDPLSDGRGHLDKSGMIVPTLVYMQVKEVIW